MTDQPNHEHHPPRPRTSRQRYAEFVEDYRHKRLDAKADATLGAPAPVAAGADSPKGLLGGAFTTKRQQSFKDYLHILRPHRKAVLWFVVLSLTVTGLQAIEPLFMRFIIDKVLLVTNVDTATRISRLNLAGAVFLLAMLANNLIGTYRENRQRKLNIKVMLTLRRALFDRLLHLPLSKLWDMKTGGILSRLTGDVDTTTGLLQLAIVSPALAMVRLLITIGVLMVINWRLALTALAIIPGIMVISFISAKRIRPIYRSIRKDVELIDGRVGETFSGIRVVRAFRREVYELLEYMRGRHTVLRKELFAQRREAVIWTGWGILTGAVNVVIVWYGGYLNVKGGASVGDIMAFQWYAFQLLGPVWNIVNSFSELQRALAATERVFDILGEPADKPDVPNAIAAPERVDEIRFEHVEFEYREGRPVVKDFTVTVPGGSVIALVGRSGAGKTTVTDLVARFHDPARGRILVNGVDIRHYVLRTYRDLLAIVQQSVFLFDGTVAENIAYGRSDATAADVEDAARRANAHEFIERLPDGYGTIVGERGVKLSGGQQQRLAIARAILADPQILILDEATSNLDTESEQLIQASMATLLAGRTTFVIAHRLSTVRRADVILVMENGAVVERGTHTQLMESGGVYHEMVTRQAEEQQGEPVAFGE